MKFLKSLVAASALIYLSGCSTTLPYEKEFSCPRSDSYGKCVGVAEAYEEAVTGQEQGLPMRPASEQNEATKQDQKKEPQSTTTATGKSAAPSSYESYESAKYEQLRKLLKEPETPMIQPGRQDRTLILSYSPDDDQQRLYMPRFVYSMYEKPRFVLGQYKLTDRNHTDSLEQFLKANQE